jgi:hypothetical protein
MLPGVPGAARGDEFGVASIDDLLADLRRLPATQDADPNWSCADSTIGVAQPLTPRPSNVKSAPSPSI